MTTGTERHFRRLRAKAAGEGRTGMPQEGTV